MDNNNYNNQSNYNPNQPNYNQNNNYPYGNDVTPNPYSNEYPYQNSYPRGMNPQQNPYYNQRSYSQQQGYYNNNNPYYYQNPQAPIQNNYKPEISTGRKIMGIISIPLAAISLFFITLAEIFLWVINPFVGLYFCIITIFIGVPGIVLGAIGKNKVGLILSIIAVSMSVVIYIQFFAMLGMLMYW